MRGDAAALACGNCRAPMWRLGLDGHYGARVDVDVCAACHLIWFDGTEGVRLTGASLVELIAAMGAAQTLAHHVLRPDAGCARCGGGLKTVHNRSRWGPSTQLECMRGHGHYRSFAQFVADRGLTRPVGPGDRAAFAARGQALHCIGCGAEIAPRDARCSHCDAIPALFDVARLARSVDPEDALDEGALHRRRAEPRQFDCPACGAAQASAVDIRCGHCGATLAVARLAEAADAVRPLAAALREHAARPSPKVVARRLATIDRNAAQQREWAAAMQAEADVAAGRARWRPDRWADWQSLSPRRVALVVAAVLVALALFGR